jgi:hypothetical protein
MRAPAIPGRGGIASLATGLRLRAQLVIATAVWLVMADAAFFGVYASPFSEGATLTGLHARAEIREIPGPPQGGCCRLKSALAHPVSLVGE